MSLFVYKGFEITFYSTDSDISPWDDDKVECFIYPEGSNLNDCLASFSLKRIKDYSDEDSLFHAIEAIVDRKYQELDEIRKDSVLYKGVMNQC